MKNNVRLVNREEITELFGNGLGEEISNSIRKQGECSVCKKQLGDGEVYAELKLFKNDGNLDKLTFKNIEAKGRGAVVLPRHQKCPQKNFNNIQDVNLTNLSYSINGGVGAIFNDVDEVTEYPFVIVNPSIDKIFIVKEHNNWPNSLINPLYSLGFFKPGDENMFKENKQVGSASIIAEKKLKITTKFYTWEMNVGTTLIESIRKNKGVFVSVGYNFDSKEFNDAFNMVKFFNDINTARGWVTLKK